MKKLIKRKKLEVFLLILVVLAFAAALFLVPGFFHAIAQDYKVMIPSGLLALTLLFAFLFLFKDLSYLSGKSREFYPLNGLDRGRRKSVQDCPVTIDSLFESFRRESVPADMTCLLFSLEDRDGNPISFADQKGGQSRLSPIFRRFTAILKLTAPDGCLLGLNEKGIWTAFLDREAGQEADSYLRRIRERIEDNNYRFPKDPIFMRSATVSGADLPSANPKAFLERAMELLAGDSAGNTENTGGGGDSADPEVYNTDGEPAAEASSADPEVYNTGEEPAAEASSAENEKEEEKGSIPVENSDTETEGADLT